MQDRDLLEAEIAQEIRQQRHLILLVDGIAPDVVAALRELRMRVGEAELHQTCCLVDRRRGHRGGAGEIAHLDHDALVGDELAGDGDRLPRIALAVLEHVLQRAPVDAARRVDLVERQVEALLPLRAILRVLAGERAAHADHDRLLGLRARRRPIADNRQHGRKQHRQSAPRHAPRMYCGRLARLARSKIAIHRPVIQHLPSTRTASIRARRTPAPARTYQRIVDPCPLRLFGKHGVAAFQCQSDATGEHWPPAGIRIACGTGRTNHRVGPASAWISLRVGCCPGCAVDPDKFAVPVAEVLEVLAQLSERKCKREDTRRVVGAHRAKRTRSTQVGHRGVE